MNRKRWIIYYGSWGNHSFVGSYRWHWLAWIQLRHFKRYLSEPQYLRLCRK